jgi:hypothetical protein
MGQLKNKQILVSSNFNINNQKLINVTDPTESQDAATKIYVDQNLSGITSLSTSLSSEVSIRSSVDTSLSTVISIISGATLEMSTIMGDDQVLGFINGNLTGVSYDTIVSSEASIRISSDTSLSTSLSNEISDRISSDISILQVINDLSGVTEQTAGSGLTYNPDDLSLNVNVDDWTIRIINDRLFGTQQWIQQTSSADVSGSTSGYTGLNLTYNPVSPVAAYINGIEYLVNPNTVPSTNYPFFYNQYPPIAGTQMWFDPIAAGFTINEGVDVVVIKYLIVEDLI